MIFIITTNCSTKEYIFKDILCKIKDFLVKNKKDIIKFTLNFMFFISIFVCSCLFYNTGHYNFFFTYKNKIFRIFLSFIIPFILTFICYNLNRDLKFIEDSTSIMMIIYIIAYFYQITFIKRATVFNTFNAMCAITTFFSVFIASIIICYFKKSNHFMFLEFYKKFFNYYSILAIFLFIEIFFIAGRNFDLNREVNFIPFNGEIKKTIVAIFDKFELDSFSRTIGNIFFFTTITFLIANYAKKNKYLLMTIIPILISISAEAMQFIFKIGDCDIDDVILNSLGTIIGVLIYKFIFEKLFLEEKICLEL